MKGIVFNLLEQIVTSEYGPRAWDDLIDSAGVDGVYAAVGSYEDAEFGRLVTAASVMLETPPDVLVRWFGKRALALLQLRYPQFFEPHQSSKPFILTLNEIIHPEVRKLFPGADVPEFSFGESGPDTVVLSYVSNRALCALAEGLVEGTAEHYREAVEIEQTECSKRGDQRCVLVCSFSPLAT